MAYLQYLRRQHRLSMQFVSKETNITYQTYRNIERREKELDMLPYRHLKDLARFYNMTINQLLEASHHYKRGK